MEDTFLFDQKRTTRKHLAKIWRHLGVQSFDPGVLAQARNLLAFLTTEMLSQQMWHGRAVSAAVNKAISSALYEVGPEVGNASRVVTLLELASEIAQPLRIPKDLPR